MNHKKNAFAVALLMSCVGSAFAAETADLRVVGKIVPAACTPTFVGGGTVDYGDIAAASLNVDTATNLADKSQEYSVVCSAPVKIATRFIDSRVGTASVSNPGHYGLGLDGTAKVGYYRLKTAGAAATTADGNEVGIIYRVDGAPDAWHSATSGFYTTGIEVGFAEPGTTAPGAYKTYSGKFDVAATIAPANTLDLSKEIPLDGLATFEISYL